MWTDRSALHPSRHQISAIASADRAPLGHADADHTLRGGLLRGALHEVFAADTAGFGFAAGLARRTGGRKPLLWIVQDFSALEHAQLSATGFVEFGIDPQSVLMMRAANATDALRACADALSCAALGAVIAEIPGRPKVLDLTASRRLVLGAEAKNVTAILLRSEAAIEPSAAQTRWYVKSAPSSPADDWGRPHFEAELVRNRQGETGRWRMEWCCGDGAFRKPDQTAAHSGAVVSAVADRSAYSGPLRRTG
jgi:protein ImuA